MSARAGLYCWVSNCLADKEALSNQVAIMHAEDSQGNEASF